jgi:hypothetical protein
VVHAAEPLFTRDALALEDHGAVADSHGNEHVVRSIVDSGCSRCLPEAAGRQRSCEDLTEHSHEPPPVFASDRVLEYAILTSVVRYSGRSDLLVGGKELGPVPRLAICQPLGETTFLLFHCDDDWNLLGVSSHTSLAEAKARAERIYAGISACWIDRQVTEADAAEYLEQEFGDERCRFCGRLPFDVEQLVVHERGGPICDACIEELHAFIHDSSESD